MKRAELDHKLAVINRNYNLNLAFDVTAGQLKLMDGNGRPIGPRVSKGDMDMILDVVDSVLFIKEKQSLSLGWAK